MGPERIEKLIGSMRSCLRLLRELGALSEAEFLADAHKISSAKYNFIAAIEAGIDLCSHVISRGKLRAPEDYADTVQVMSEAGILGAMAESAVRRGIAQLHPIAPSATGDDVVDRGKRQ